MTQNDGSAIVSVVVFSSLYSLYALFQSPINRNLNHNLITSTLFQTLTGFADGYPLLLTTTESLADLNAHLAAKNAAPMKAYKFRPNIIVSAATEDDERRQAKKAGAGVSADTDAGVNVNADAGADAGNYVDASIIRARNMVEEEARKTAQAFPPLTAWAEHTWKEIMFMHPDPVQQNQKYADTGDANGQDDRNNKGESAENSTREMNGNTGTVKFDVAKKCGRCMMTTLDEEQKRRKDGEPLKTLRTLSANHTGEAVFGENIIQHTDSVGQSISVGDVVYVSKYRTAEEIAAQSPKSKYAAHFDSVYEPLLSLAVTITGSCLIYCCLQEAGRL